MESKVSFNLVKYPVRLKKENLMSWADKKKNTFIKFDMEKIAKEKSERDQYEPNQTVKIPKLPEDEDELGGHMDSEVEWWEENDENKLEKENQKEEEKNTDLPSSVEQPSESSLRRTFLKIAVSAPLLLSLFLIWRF